MRRVGVNPVVLGERGKDNLFGLFQVAAVTDAEHQLDPPGGVDRIIGNRRIPDHVVRDYHLNVVHRRQFGVEKRDVLDRAHVSAGRDEIAELDRPESDQHHARRKV